jgi:hypothetical protein
MRNKWLVATFVAVGVLAMQSAALYAQPRNNGGFVSGHTEGMPPIDGRLCVTYIQGINPHTECKTFSTGGQNDIAISIPEQGVATATFTVEVGNGTGPSGYWPTVDSLYGGPCTAKALTAPAGMALCQSTAPEFESQVHRFNTIWNTNSSGNGTPGRCVGPQPGAAC